MYPPLFLYRTIIGRCWVGLLKLYSSKLSWYWGAQYAHVFEKSTSSRKLVLLWRRQEDSASRTETFGDFLRTQRPQKPNFELILLGALNSSYFIELSVN
jgi:hypothetical protein